MRADASQLGLELSEAVPILGCALVSTESDGFVAARVYYSQRTFVLDAWNNTLPSQLRMQFLFDKGDYEFRPGSYCLQLVFNSWLTKTMCDAGSLPIEVFAIPPALYSPPKNDCHVIGEVADYLYFNRNFARELVVKDREVYYDEIDSSLLCVLDNRTFNYLDQIYRLKLQELNDAEHAWSL